MKKFREARSTLKQLLVKKQQKEDDQAFQKEVEKRRKLNEEALRLRADEQKEIEAATILNIEREKEWLERKLQESERDNHGNELSTIQRPIGKGPKVYYYAFHRRLQGLDPVLELIRNRGRQFEHIGDK